MRIHILSGNVSWFGSKSGFGRLPEYVGRTVDVSVLSSGSTKSTRAFAKLIFGLGGEGFARSPDRWPDLMLVLKSVVNKGPFHVLWGEDHLCLTDTFFWKKLKKRVVFTLHQPPHRLTESQLAKARRLHHVNLLYKRDVTFWRDEVGVPKVSFIHYGVDTEFFVPSQEMPNSNQFVSVGRHLRDFEMLCRVVSLLSERINTFRLVLVAPGNYYDYLPKHLISHPNVEILQGLSDVQLRLLYQKSVAHLMPMVDVGASTAIVESLACGLPIISTDVGGVRDYGGGDVFSVVECGDAEAMANCAIKLAVDQKFRATNSAKHRAFAEEHLDHRIIAQQYVQLYTSIC